MLSSMGRPMAVAMWLLVGVGCASPDELDAIEVCDAICSCTAPLPSQHDRCTGECEADLAGRQLPDACVTCAREASCSQLNACFDLCFAQGVPEGNP